MLLQIQITKKYLRLLARPDLIRKLHSEATPQVKIAWVQKGFSYQVNIASNEYSTLLVMFV